MSLKNLDAMFNPRRIAVIGASENEASIGCHVFRNLIGKGYTGIAHPVNKDAKGVQGVEAYHNIADIPHPVDLALVAAEPEELDGVLKDCGRKGVKGVVILTHDLASRAADVKGLNDKIVRLSSRYGCRVLGPNSLGFLRPAISLNASLYPGTVQRGNIALISESGVFASSFLDTAIAKKVGFSYFISLGAKLDINIADTIDFLGCDGGTRAIFLFVQTINNGRRFMTAARNFSRSKPIVVVKPGKIDGITDLSLFDAEPLSEGNLVYEAVFKRAGCLRVDSLVDLLYMAETIAKQNRPRGQRLMIVSNCLAPSDIALEALHGMGGEAAEPTSLTLARIDKGLNGRSSLANPLALRSDAGSSDYQVALENCLCDEGVDGLLVICLPFPGVDIGKIAETIVNAARSQPRVPIFATWFGRENVRSEIDFLNNSGIPTFDTPEQAVKSFMYMYRYDANLRLLQETPETLLKDFSPRLDIAAAAIDRCRQKGRSSLSIDESVEVLDAYGIPVAANVHVTSPIQAVQAAEKLGYPVALKIDKSENDCLNRSDITLLNLTNEKAVSQAYRNLQEKLTAYSCHKTPILMQSMLQRRGYELVIGAHKTKSFGSVISFGLGGKYLQAERDYTIGLPPLNQTLARRMMEETRIYLHVLRRQEFRPGLRQLEEILVRFSQLIIDLPQLGAIYINPVILSETGSLARDVVMHIDKNLPQEYQWAKGDLCPRHLSIAPYPFKYERDVRLADGTGIHIRPIRGEDEPALATFFSNLSEKSVFYRFGQRRINMPHAHLARFCQVDYDRDLAFLAVSKGPPEEIIGEVRLNRFADLESAELSFVVGDQWQGKGIGSLLMEFCIHLARDAGVKTLLMEVMTSNTRMIRFGHKYHFEHLPGSKEDDMIEMQRRIG